MANNEQLECLQNEHGVEIPYQLTESSRDNPRWMELVKRQADLKLEIEVIRSSMKSSS